MKWDLLKLPPPPMGWKDYALAALILFVLTIITGYLWWWLM